MVKRARWAMLLALGVSAGAAPLLAHCGGGDDTASTPNKAPGTGTTTQHVCKSPKKLTVGQLHPSETYEGVLEGTATGADNTQWTVRIQLDDTEDSKTVSGQTYDLSKENANYDSCQRCVLGFQGDNFTGASRQLFQTSGTLHLDTVASPPTAVSKGTLSKVLLREVKVEGMEAAMADVKGGSCYELDLDWSTLPAPGTKCTTAEDCGGGTSCDPADGTCKAFQCEAETGKGCDASTQVCVVQEDGASYGVCYPRCKLFDSSKGCSSDHQCVANNGDQTDGVCLTTGPGAVGQTCTSTALTTGCQVGLTCQLVDDSEQGVCQPICDFFGTAAGCGAGQRCAYGGLCTSDGDPATLGSPCSAESDEGTSCAGGASTWQGVCIALTTYPGDGTEPEVALTCLRSCRDASVCATGETCGLTNTELALPYCSKSQETP